MLVSNGDDIRKLPLSIRKTSLARLLARGVDGIFLSNFEQREIGPDLFRKACEFGLEGLVSKHRDRAYYRAGAASDGSRSRIPRILPSTGSKTLTTKCPPEEKITFGESEPLKRHRAKDREGGHTCRSRPPTYTRSLSTLDLHVGCKSNAYAFSPLAMPFEAP
jgi:hypothetical protein